MILSRLSQHRVWYFLQAQQSQHPSCRQLVETDLALCLTKPGDSETKAEGSGGERAKDRMPTREKKRSKKMGHCSDSLQRGKETLEHVLMSEKRLWHSSVCFNCPRTSVSQHFCVYLGVMLLPTNLGLGRRDITSENEN